MMNSWLKKYKIPVLIFIGAVFFRLILLQFRYAVLFDEVNYLKLGIYGAKNGFEHTFHPFWPLLYPLIIGFFAKIFSHYELMARLVTLILQALIIFPLFEFTFRQYGKKAASGAAALWAFSPDIALFSTYIFSESLYTLLAFCGLYLGWIVLNDRKPWFYAVLPGLFWGLAYLTRPEGIGFLTIFGLILFALIVVRIITKHKMEAWFIKVGLAALFAFLIISMPYLIYLKHATGAWTISGKMESQKQGEAYALIRTEDESDRFRMVIDENQPILIDQIWHQGTFVKNQQLSDQPMVQVSKALFIQKFSRNIYQIWKDSLPRILTPVVFVLLILGIFARPWHIAQWLFNGYVLSFMGFFIVVLIPAFHITDRYFYPLLPLFFIWAGVGICYLTHWLKDSIRNLLPTLSPVKQKISVGLLCVFIFTGGIIIPQMGSVVTRSRYASDLFADPVEHKEIAFWLKQYDQNARVISVFHSIDFYLGNFNIRKTVSLPDEPLSRVLLYARKNDANYLLLDERYKSYFPKIAWLLETEDVPTELSLIYQWEKINEINVRLFKIEAAEHVAE